VNIELPAEFLDHVAAQVAAEILDRIELPKQWPEWMNIDTAAAYLDISPERLHKLKQRDAVPYVQDGPGARVFFCRSDLDCWMRSQTRTEDE
jgi:hypothetical protein